MSKPLTKLVTRTVTSPRRSQKHKTAQVPSRRQTPAPDVAQEFFCGQKYLGEPRVLLLDIETSTNLAHVWGKWEQDVIEFERHWYMLCFSYKWMHEKKTHVVALPDFKGYKKHPEDDKALLKKLHALLCAADVVVGHNFSRFDQRKINARFLVHKLPPPTPFAIVDTLKIARRLFAFDSNKLDDLGQQLGLGRKTKTHGKATWLGAMRGDMKEWRNMISYSRQDTILENELLMRLLPWVPQRSNRQKPVVSKHHA